MNTLDESAMRSLLRDAIARAGSQKELAQSLGISETYVSDLLAGRRRMAEGISRMLGYRLVIRYEPLPHAERSA